MDIVKNIVKGWMDCKLAVLEESSLADWIPLNPAVAELMTVRPDISPANI